MAANDSKSYLSYWNKFVGEYKNMYHYPISKMPLHVDYFCVAWRNWTES